MMVKKRPKNEDETIAIFTRVTPDLADKIDVWRVLQRPIPSRPEAVRRLVELGFMAAAKKKPRQS